MVAGKETPRLDGLDTVQGALVTIERYFDNGWTDGLPIVPPTEELVGCMLEASGRDPMEVLGIIPPRMGVATVEAVATNAVMAGCRPEYIPVVIAAVEALVDESFDLQGLQATSDPAAPMQATNLLWDRLPNIPTVSALTWTRPGRRCTPR